ncbi:hypothetical protein Cgig2_005349 [Carnegiea gigantea]|uniref:ER membrane protein complex subunit 3 n=1 Tax=Carnegiea gigantea TaxID=171969 RepID=A0A9Q1K754_9CARY|nr:hypothetical protein Cgig2_005349 [Carnegiea gigantea]
MAEDLVRDTAIRDRVLIPLSVVMVLIGILRCFVSKLKRSFQVPDPNIVIIRARNLRSAANFIPSRSFRARRIYFQQRAKIPFPLTQRFRSMLQNGIDLSIVDVSYVSSRPWYFLNLFGLRGVFSLMLGEENAMDDTQRMMKMGLFGFDPTKSLSAEEGGLDIVQHEWVLPNLSSELKQS